MDFKSLRELGRLSSKKIGKSSSGSGDAKSEMEQFKAYLKEARAIFNQKKPVIKSSGNDFLHKISLTIENSLDELDGMVNTQEFDVDTFLLYKIRNSINDLEEKINYIKKV